MIHFLSGCAKSIGILSSTGRRFYHHVRGESDCLNVVCRAGNSEFGCKHVGITVTATAPVLRLWVGSTVLAVGIRYCYLATGQPAISLSTQLITHFINYYPY